MGLSTHILDTTLGKPASGVALELLQHDGAEFRSIGRGTTDADGRCRTLLGDHALEAATYKLHFAVGEYFAASQQPTLFPFVEIVFAVTNASQHHHVPLLISANGYTTYRGS